MKKILKLFQRVKEEIGIWLSQSKNKPSVFLLQLLIFFLPTQFGIHLWPDSAFVSGIRVDYLAPTFYITDFLLILFVIQVGSRRLFRHTKLLLLIIVFSFLNILFALHPLSAFFKWLKVCEMIFFAIAVSQTKLKANDISLPIYLSLVYTYLIAFLQFLKGGSLGGVLYFLGERVLSTSGVGIALGNIFGENFLRPYSTFSHPNSLTGFVLVNICLLFALKSKRNDNGFLITFIFVGTLLILVNSLAVYIAILAIILYFLLGKLNYLRKLPKAKILFLITIFVSLALPVLSNNFLKILPNHSERIWLSYAAGDMFSKSPLFGIGLNNFFIELPKTLLPKEIIWELQPVHNIFLLMLTETGIAGLLGVTIFIFKIINKANSVTNKKFFLPLIAILITGLFDHYWLTLQQNLLIMFLVFGLLHNKHHKLHI